MFYYPFLPVLSLRPYVKCIWVLEGYTMPSALNNEKILPDGCIEFITHYGNVFKRVYNSGVIEAQPASFLIGQIKNYIQVAGDGNIGVIGIRFYPNGLSAFTNMPVNQLTGETVTPSDIFGNIWYTVEQKLQEASTPEKIGMLQNMLVKLLDRSNNKFDFVTDSIVRKIMLHEGQVDLYTILKQYKISERHFERQFKKAVGINPKFFARLVRFNSIMQQAETTKDSSLISLAYMGGYYDQAHFSKDFKQFTGESPGEYLKANHAMASAFLQ